MSKVKKQVPDYTITATPKVIREKSCLSEVKEGEKYFARWNFNYNLCDEMQGEIEIVHVYENKSYLFGYTTKWGTTTWDSSKCRHVELIRKIV